MLRLNLSTRPFYNERALHITLTVVGVLLLGLLAVSALEIVRLSAAKTALETAVVTDQARATDARQRAERLRAEVKQEELEQVLAEAREANTLIDRRTFSWTELFNYLEATLPADVMLKSVRPSVEDGQVMISLGVVGREVDHIDEFMNQLEQTGAFSGMLAKDESREEDGTLRANLEGRYVAGVMPTVERVRTGPGVAPGPQEVRR